MVGTHSSRSQTVKTAVQSSPPSLKKLKSFLRILSCKRPADVKWCGKLCLYTPQVQKTRSSTLMANCFGSQSASLCLLNVEGPIQVYSGSLACMDLSCCLDTWILFLRNLMFEKAVMRMAATTGTVCVSPLMWRKSESLMVESPSPIVTDCGNP